MKRTLVVIAILLLGLILKLHNYDVYPQRGASSDEYTYSFLGLSLITKHYPESWSNFSNYKNLYDLKIRGIYFPMVHPYFDHPPLNGLLVAGWALFNGENTYQKIELSVIRLVPVALSVVSSILVFLIARRLYDYPTAIWALLIYMTTTIFVMNTRVVFAENLVTPIMLFAIYFFDKYSRRLNPVKVIFLGILSGLAVLAKELGVVVYLTLAYFFLTEKNKLREFSVLTFSFLLVALSYVVYGFYFDRNTFLSVVLHQATRPVGPQVLQMLTQAPIIVNKVYYDGWYFFGWLALFFALSDISKNKRIVVPFLVYFLLLVISLNREGEMGWYMIPVFPLMAIAGSRMIREGIAKNSWLIFTLLTFVGIPQIKLLYEDNFGLTTAVFRILIFFMYGPFLIALLLKKEKLFNNLGKLWFYIFILINIILTYSYIHPA